MTQPTDITLANQSGANFRTELNSILQGFGTTQKGATAPSYAVTGMHWIDDSGTPWIEKVYDGSDWISIYEINATTNTIRVINQANGSVRTGAANIGQIQDSSFIWLGTSSNTNTLTASATPAITAYAAGQVFRFIVGTTNTGAATLNINSVGAANIQFQGAALAANSLVAGHVVTVVYDGTDFQVVSPIGGTEGDILYYNASNALTRLPKGTNDQVLTLASGLPSWSDTSSIKRISLNSQSTAYTAVLSDANGSILHPSADVTARTWTIPSNASVAYPIGTTLTFVNQNGAGVLTITITDDTMRLADDGDTGNRTLTANGVATAYKITATEWIISGVGLS